MERQEKGALGWVSGYSHNSKEPMTRKLLPVLKSRHWGLTKLPLCVEFKKVIKTAIQGSRNRDLNARIRKSLLLIIYRAGQVLQKISWSCLPAENSQKQPEKWPLLHFLLANNIYTDLMKWNNLLAKRESGKCGSLGFSNLCSKERHSGGRQEWI